jgi:predicted acyl esterase
VSAPKPARRSRTVTALTLAAALLAATPLTPAPAAWAGTPQTAAAQAGPPSLRFTDIPGSDGVMLKGNVFEPTAPGPHPLLVLPTSWSFNDLEYLAQAKKLAQDGWVVVSYTPRGFWGSGGRIEVAGPPDIADFSRVIDWALANTGADPARIGTAGISYGAGIGLIAAAHDPRVKAVAGMSGWADLAESLYSSHTQHLQSVGVLGLLGYLTGRPSEDLRERLGDYFGDVENEAEVRAWAAVRSASTYVDRLNANGTAIMLANAWGDSVFPPNQLTAFHQRLTGPKRLELRPGDHVTAEATGLLGLPNDVWTNARAWLDHHVRGIDNGIDRQPPVRLRPQLQDGYENHPDWQSVSSTTRRLGLGARDWAGTGPLGPTGSSGTNWQTPIGTNLDSGANGGLILLSNLATQFLRIPPTVAVPLLPRPVAAVWQSERYGEAQRVRGAVRVHVSVTPSAERGSLVAYLYDVDALGVGRLVSHAPYTFLNRTPGSPFAADFALQAIAYDVPAGHRLALVVDTVDPLYLTHNPAWSTLTFGSPAGDPSWIEVPLR